ncbi:MAG: hypothetical protein ABIJ59_02815 [Pseudomonadota bacterium]
MKIFKSVLIVISSLAVVLIILTAVATAEKPVHPGYPYVFDMTGKLDRISDNKLVIDDVLCRLSSSTAFHAPDTIFTKASSFKKNDLIGVIFSDKQKREVVSVWLLNRSD